MQKYPNGGKVTTKKSEIGKANETISPCDEGLSQIYQSSDLIVHEVDYEDDSFKMYATSSLDHGICPYCGHRSHSVHSRYVRTIQDLSILGRRVIMRLGVRKFFCRNRDCRRKTLRNSLVTRCSVTADVPADAREPLQGRAYPCLLPLQAGCLSISAYTSALPQSCATCTGCGLPTTGMSGR